MSAGAKGRLLSLAAGVTLLAAGGAALGMAAAAQQRPPQPTAAQAGVTGPAARPRPPIFWLARPHVSARQSTRASRPVSISIPAIGVQSPLLPVGLTAAGTIQVPPLDDPPVTNEAAWYKYSPIPGQPGASVIVGHVDSARSGPSVFFRLGALWPGDRVDVELADRQVAVFQVTGVRMYPKAHFPTKTVYGFTDYPALRLITCGGSFNYQAHHYSANIVVFAVLVRETGTRHATAETPAGRVR